MKTLVTILLFAGVSTSQAALFTGTTSGEFSNPQGGVNAISNIDRDNQRIRWGNGTYGDGVSSNTSALWFFDRNFNFDFDPATGTSDEFVLGGLWFSNGKIPAGTEINSVDLSIDLLFTSPSDINDLFSFDLSLSNTPNGLANSDDSVSFLTSTSTESFTFNGYNYSLEILGFDTLNDGVINVEDVFSMAEEQAGSRNIIAQLTSTAVAVPEPSVTALFGTGLIGLAGFARRRKNKG